MSNGSTLRAPASAAISISLIRPTSSGALPMRRIFEDQQGNQIEQLDLWNYDYDARKRSWYLDTLEADRPVISSPYVSFSYRRSSDNRECTAAGNSAWRYRRRSQARQFQRLRQCAAAWSAWNRRDFRLRRYAHCPPGLCAVRGDRPDTSVPPATPQHQGDQGRMVPAVLKGWDGRTNTTETFGMKGG